MNVIGVEDVRVGCPVSIDSLSDLNGPSRFVRLSDLSASVPDNSQELVACRAA